jgi:hypothetical protein
MPGARAASAAQTLRGGREDPLTTWCRATVCMDKYEASVWRVPAPTTTNKSLVKRIRDRDDLETVVAVGEPSDSSFHGRIAVRVSCGGNADVLLAAACLPAALRVEMPRDAEGDRGAPLGADIVTAADCQVPTVGRRRECVVDPAGVLARSTNRVHRRAAAAERDSLAAAAVKTDHHVLRGTLREVVPVDVVDALTPPPLDGGRTLVTKRIGIERVDEGLGASVGGLKRQAGQ